MEIAVANIAKDKQGETVFKDVNKLADAVYDMVVEIAEGKEVSGLNGKFNNNNIDVPSKLLDPRTSPRTTSRIWSRPTTSPRIASTS